MKVNKQFAFYKRQEFAVVKNIMLAVLFFSVFIFLLELFSFHFPLAASQNIFLLYFFSHLRRGDFRYTAIQSKHFSRTQVSDLLRFSVPIKKGNTQKHKKEA